MPSYDMMDDLIASFSGAASISQEANDLRALQAQLSSSLMMAGSSRAAASRPCPTTPTMGTMDLAQLPPSATPSPQTNVHHSFGHQGAYQAPAEDWTQDMMDEEMIEQSLLGLDNAPQPHPHHHQQQSSLGLQNHYAHINPTPVAPAQYFGAEDNSLSSYAAMDPFFAAQLQAAQQQQQQQQQQQASYFGGFAPARGFGARQSSAGAFGSRF